MQIKHFILSVAFLLVNSNYAQAFEDPMLGYFSCVDGIEVDISSESMTIKRENSIEAQGAIFGGGTPYFASVNIDDETFMTVNLSTMTYTLTLKGVEFGCEQLVDNFITNNANENIGFIVIEPISEPSTVLKCDAGAGIGIITVEIDGNSIKASYSDPTAGGLLEFFGGSEIDSTGAYVLISQGTNRYKSYLRKTGSGYTIAITGGHGLSPEYSCI